MLTLLAYASFGWASLELLFFGVVMWYLAPKMNRLETPPEYPIDGRRLMYKILETVDWLSTQKDADLTFESFLSGWFLGAQCSELRRGNLVELLAFSTYAKELSALTERERKDVLELVAATEERLGYQLKPGYNDKVDSIRYALDPAVPFTHRPLALYAVCGLARAVAHVVLSLVGFRRQQAPCGRFFYWYRRHRDEHELQRQRQYGSVSLPASAGPLGPMVLFHGVGAGLPLYVLTIWKLCRDRTSVIVESPSIMMSLALLWGHRPPSESQLVESVAGIMERHGLQRASFFGHSFGSISVAWMVRRKPHLVSQIALLDPACLLLFLSNVARSFLYPDNSRMPVAERLVRFLMTTEMGISHTLRRHSWWYANILWPEDVTCPIVVGLAGKDPVIPAKPIRRYVLAHSMFATSSSSPHGVNMSSVEGLINGGGGSANDQPASGRRREDKHSGGKIPAAPTEREHHESSHGGAAKPHDGRAAADVRGGGCGINGSGGLFSPIAEKGGGFEGNVEIESGDGGAGAIARRVELVYWPDAVHGEVLTDPSALDEFVRVAARQEKAFSAS